MDKNNQRETRQVIRHNFLAEEMGMFKNEGKGDQSYLTANDTSQNAEGRPQGSSLKSKTKKKKTEKEEQTEMRKMTREEQLAEIKLTEEISSSDESNGVEVCIDNWIGADDSEMDKILGAEADQRLALLSQKPIIESVMDEQYNKSKLNSVFQQVQQTLKIFKEIKELSIGTFKYESAKGLVSQMDKENLKKFVPMFPHLYLKENSKESSASPNDVKNFNLQNLECNFFDKHLRNAKDSSEDKKYNQMRLPSQIQLKFQMNDKDLTPETREYQAKLQELQSKAKTGSGGSNEQFNQNSTLPFNLRSFQMDMNLNQYRSNSNHAPKIMFDYERDDEGKRLENADFFLVIELGVPAPFYEEKAANSRSFQAAHDKKKFCKVLSPMQLENDLLNYWNLKQVIYIRGTGQSNLTYNHFDKEGHAGIEELCQKLVEQELISSFESSFLSNKKYDFSLMDSETYGQEPLNQVHQKILKQGLMFDEKVSQLAMPLRLSLMVPISNARIQIFEPQIIELMDALIEKGFTLKNQQKLQIQQGKEFWDSGTPQAFEYKMYQIALEQMVQRGKLEGQTLIGTLANMLQYRDQKTGKNFVEVEAKEQISNPNRLAQRRMYLTPTLKIIRPMQIEQSNSILRELKYCLEYLVRVNILGDNFCDEWFNSGDSAPLLEQFVTPAINQISFCGIDLKFLNYSASQIKQKSWWDYIDNHQFKIEEEVKDGNGQDQGSSGSSKAVSLLAKLSHTNPNARDEFLQFIGQFGDKNKPLKQLARQGQSMSSSTHICELKPYVDGKSNEFEMIQDIKSIGGEFTFTDGSGYASEEIMQRVANQFEFNRVCAIQMRFGGFKGVLIVHPGLGKDKENGEKTPQLLLRESMKKFDGKLLELGVIRCSTYSPAYLNRQVILLLDYLNVDPQIFIDKNESALRNLDVKATIKRLQKQAVKIRSTSKKLDPKEAIQKDADFVDEVDLFFGPSRQFKKIFVRAMLLISKYHQEYTNSQGKIVKEVFQLDKEPIFSAILHNMVLGQAQTLKKKQRIRLRDAAVLIGVADIDHQVRALDSKVDDEQLSTCNYQESEMLQEGEVFCQIEPTSFAKDDQESKQIRKELGPSLKCTTERKDAILKQISHPSVNDSEECIKLIEGDVLVTKNPCGHRGDIRLAKAIGSNHPAFKKLKHLVNVIVFSSKGSRPLENMMSGGDLDGDVYMIMWDKDLVEGAKKGYPKKKEAEKREKQRQTGTENYKNPQDSQELWPEPSSCDNESELRVLTEDLGSASTGFAETICGYFSRDVLGQMSHLHLRLALELGVEDPATEQAAYLCSVQVDFAKHGRCIKVDAMDNLKKKLKNPKPKFLADEDVDDADVYSPDHIIQKLYDAADKKIKGLFEDCMKVEHTNSILHAYEFNQHIISLRVTNQSPLLEFHPKDIANLLKLTPYLQYIYNELIHEMEQELRDKLLIKFRLVNEGELFCSDFQFRFSDPKSQDYIGFLGKSNEDTQNDIKQDLDKIIKEFRNKFKEYTQTIALKEFPEHLKKLREEERKQEEEKESMASSASSRVEDKEKKDFNKFKQEVTNKLAKALYFASYFHDEHPQSAQLIQFISRSKDEEGLSAFKEEVDLFEKFVKTKREACMETKQLYYSEQIKHPQQHDMLRAELRDFEKYKQVCKKAEADNMDRLNLLWSFKKMFSVPWLIAYDNLLV